ncbi:hypothetical protein WN944_006413 [Citrus x changshan-huyou]|uniref:Uncharacterized protein n=1 Tax=Citrus x changshan-huyou TaxID=2935761 RepID=A0AAP0MJ42_9ROSI
MAQISLLMVFYRLLTKSCMCFGRPMKLPLLYLHGDAVIASITILSDARLRSNPNEYDHFNKKSQSLNLSSELKFLLLITTATSSTHGVISEPFVEAALFVSIWISDRDSRDAVASRSNELSSRLGRILAAIMGTNGDSVRKIPARHKGIVKMKKISVWQKGLVFQNKQMCFCWISESLLSSFKVHTSLACEGFSLFIYVSGESGGRLAEFAMAKESLTVARPQEVFKFLQLKLLAYLVLKNIMITAASGGVDVLGSAVGFAVFTIVLLSWALTFAIGGEHLFGSAWDKLVMYNVAERLGLIGWR